MNSPVQNNAGGVGRQFLEHVSSRSQSDVGSLSGQEVKKSGFSWGTAGRILAGIVTLGLSEAGYAIYKGCTRPATDNDRPMGGAKTYLNKVNEPAIQDKAALAKVDILESWNMKENKLKLNIDGWQAQLPMPFAKDAINRGDVRFENGKLVAVLQGEEFNGSEDHKLEKMALVDAFTSVTLASGDASDDTKGIFKQNLFSFTHQGAAAMFLNVIFNQTGLSPLDPNGSFNFTFSAQDGQNVLVEQRFNADKIPCFGNSKGAPKIQEIGPLTSKIIFSIPIDQLRRPDFNPSCLTVISADWVLNS